MPRDVEGCPRDVSLLRNWEFLYTRKVRDLEYLKISLKISRKMGIFNHHWCFEHQTFKWVWIRRRHRSPQVFPQSRPNGDGHRRRLAAKNRTKSFSNLFALEIALGNVSSFQVTHLYKGPKLKNVQTCTHFCWENADKPVDSSSGRQFITLAPARQNAAPGVPKSIVPHIFVWGSCF